MVASEGLPVQLATRVPGVTDSGYYAWRTRAASAGAIRHIWLTDQILAVHALSKGTYGARRERSRRGFLLIKGFYNARRRYSLLDNLSPADFENIPAQQMTRNSGRPKAFA